MELPALADTHQSDWRRSPLEKGQEAAEPHSQKRTSARIHTWKRKWMMSPSRTT
jgi:hypothetical protein